MAQDPFAQFAVKDDPFAAYAAKPEPQTLSVMEMGRRSVGGHEGDPSTLERLNEALAPMARPQSGQDIGHLVLMNAPVGEAVNATVGRLMRPIGKMAVRGAASVGDVVSPDLVGAFSPRIGNAMRVAQRVRDAMPAAEGGALPPAGPHLDLSTPMRPSQLTPQQMAERLQAVQAQGGAVPPPGRSPVYAPRPVPGSVTPPVPLDAPPPPALAPVTHGPATAPKVVGTLRRFSSDLKGQPGPRGTVGDISSGVEPGSADAAAMERMHRYDAETVNRYRHMMDNPNGAIALAAGPTLAELIRRKLRGGAASTDPSP